MRDPNRIKVICDALAECWATVPDLRLGQLIYNIMDNDWRGDIFYPEDHQWLKWIQQYQEDSKGKYVFPKNESWGKIEGMITPHQIIFFEDDENE